MRTLKMKVFALTLSAICVASCGRGGNGCRQSPKRRNLGRAQLESMQKIAAQTAQTYKDMDNDALLKKLVEQSTARREAV